MIVIRFFDCSYPTSKKKVISDVTIQCSMNSRIAVIGANGAGKSTIIKLLTGELEPQEGICWKHPNVSYSQLPLVVTILLIPFAMLSP